MSCAPFPPLPEQDRIVAKVDRLLALCDQLEAQLIKQTEKQTALLNEVIEVCTKHIALGIKVRTFLHPETQSQPRCCLFPSA